MTRCPICHHSPCIGHLPGVAQLKRQDGRAGRKIPPVHHVESDGRISIDLAPIDYRGAIQEIPWKPMSTEEWNARARRQQEHFLRCEAYYGPKPYSAWNVLNATERPP